MTDNACIGTRPTDQALSAAPTEPQGASALPGNDPSRVILHIAAVAQVFGWQAGVGGMETAGSIISYLAKNPDRIDAFMKTGSVMDWPLNWHVDGCLSWHGQDGKVYRPEDVRLRDSDGSPEGGDGEAGSVHDSADPKGIAQPLGESH